MKKIIVAGNWKMNKTFLEAKEFIAKMNQKSGINTQVIIAAPSLYLDRLVENNNSENVFIAAQNCNENKSGAFTGEISSHMLASLDVTYCLVGHSERRMYYGESDNIISLKINQCLGSKIKPILCIGESLSEREANQTFEIVKLQLEQGLLMVNRDLMHDIIIAYEPVWAIGTGKTATKEQAQEVHEFIYNWLKEKYGQEIADITPILYGGSCNLENAATLFSQKNIWGGLIGGASLEFEMFSQIIDIAASLNKND